MRILFKLSGELISTAKTVIDEEKTLKLAETLITISKNHQLSIVMGGGNILRGRDSKKLPSYLNDEVGMLATFINAKSMINAIGFLGGKAKIYAPFTIDGIAEKFCPIKANEDLNTGYILFFAGGAGQPFFSTDTISVIRARQLEVDFLLKGTKVDGIYDKDPQKFTDAKRFEKLSYQEAIEKNLKIMDKTAFYLAMEGNLKIKVFKAVEFKNLEEIVNNKCKFTLVE